MTSPEGERPHVERTPKPSKQPKPPPVSPAHESRQSPSFRPAVFGNCIVRDLIPSSERLDEMVAEGAITEAQAAQFKKGDLIGDRLLLIGERIVEIKDTLRDSEISTTEKRPLRAEYKSLRKEHRRLHKEVWHS